MNTIKMADKLSYRWAFNVTSWLPNESDILLAGGCIQNEEKIRINKFVYQQDLKSSLIGRLMMRKFVNVATGLPYSDIIFFRDSKGKPVLGHSGIDVDFNVSHQGDYVVLAGQIGKVNVGVDVMKTTAPANKNVTEFFRLMNRQFSSVEWKTITRYESQKNQLASFYRHWCLKESYVKNIGVGITVDLQSISFDIKSDHVTVGEYLTDTNLRVNGVQIKDWIFEETLLDSSHGVAVAVNLNGNPYACPTPFTFLTFEQLMSGSAAVIEQDQLFCKNYFKKEAKPF